MKNDTSVVAQNKHLARACGALAGLSLFAAAFAVQVVPGANIVDGTAGFAAITWNFAGVTAEFEGLGTAIVSGLGLAIAGGLVVWGVIRGFKPMLRVLGRLIG